MSSLSRYGKSAIDKTYPDCDESVLGHMVIELGMSPDEAVQNLRPWVRDLDRSSEMSKSVCYGVSVVGAGVGLLVGATMGVGIVAALPIVAAGYSFLLGQKSAQEHTTRESEYLLLKSCPEILKLIYALSKRGLPKEALIECYDELLGNFTANYQQRASLGVSEELDHDIVRSFQEIVSRKCEAEKLGRSIVEETQDFRFDTLYQSTEPTAPRIEPSRPIGNQTKLGAVDVPSQSFVIPVASPESKLFDWNQLNTVYDDFPHLLLLGKTGAGKSFLAEKLGHFLNGTTIVITPKKKPKDFIGLQVIGVPYDFATIAANITGLSEVVKSREAEMDRTGEENFQPINVVLDEVPTFVAGCKDSGLDVVKDLRFIIRAGRTSKVRLILLAQGQEVKTLGIEGEGSLRDNLSYVYLKGFAEDYAKKLGVNVSKYDRPCLIDGKVADISQLIALTSEPTPSEIVELKPTATPEMLDRLFNMPSADHEVDESGSEQDSIESDLKTAFPNWNSKSIEVAVKVVRLLNKEPERKFKAHEIKSGNSELKKAGIESAKKLLSKLAEAGFIQMEGDDYSAIVSQDDDDFNW